MRWTRRRSWCVAAALVLCGVGGLAALAWLHALPRLPYRDRFATAGLAGWQSIGGTWSTRGGVLTNESDERGAKLLTGSRQWSNYSLSGDVEILGPEGDAGLVIRSSDEELGSDSYNGYYAGLRTLDGTLVLGRANHGWIEAQTVPVAGGVHVGRWYHLEVVAVNCTIAAAAYDLSTGMRTTALMQDHHCVQRGRIGLRSYSTGSRWREVRASRSGYAEIAALHAVEQPWRMAVLYQSGVDYLQPSQPPGGYAAPGREHSGGAPVSIAALRYASALEHRRVRIRGTIVLRRPMLFVQDSTGGIAVPVADPERFTAGEEVEASGIPVNDAFSLALRDAEVQILGAGKPLPPKSVTASEAATGVYDGQYIELTGELRGREKNAPAPTLWIDAGSQSFRAVLPDGPGSAALPRLPVNGLIRVRGVEAVDPRYTQNLTPFVLLVSSSNGVELLAGPPWWSLENMVWLGPILVILILVFQMVRVHYRHSRIQAVAEERQRLGHELHDTLAQSFAGIGYQLQAIHSGLATGDSSVSEHVKLAKEMVRHSHQEARRSIASMHPELTQSAPIAAALEQGARQMVQGTTLRIVARTTGEAKPLPPRIQDALFRIGQEAISNAVRHGLPKLLEIVVAYQPRTIRLVIQDDGKGFDTAAELPGFGLRGMRRRADAIDAEFNVTSRPGEGVRVEARAHLKPEFALATRLARRRRQGATAV